MNILSYQIIQAAIEVHSLLGGPGLLESVYEAALCHELELRKFQVQRQMALPVFYKGIAIRDPLYIDLFVEGKVIVEVKATELEHVIHQTQLLTYLRIADVKLGLLINFGKKRVTEGIHRVINGF